MGLAGRLVPVFPPQAIPGSPDAAGRMAAVEHLKWAIRCTHAAGADVLSGPMHSALGAFSGAGPTDEERKRCADVLRAAAEEAAQANV
jgi:D-psicose/D-tagatose/L-ribulose 3-epimerase